jgi:hypothetical protein
LRVAASSTDARPHALALKKLQRKSADEITRDTVEWETSRP